MLTAEKLAVYLLCYVDRDDLDTVSKSLKLNPKEIEQIDRSELRALVFRCINCRRWFHTFSAATKTATDRAEPTCKLCAWSLRDVSVSDGEFLRQCAIKRDTGTSPVLEEEGYNCWTITYADMDFLADIGAAESIWELSCWYAGYCLRRGKPLSPEDQFEMYAINEAMNRTRRAPIVPERPSSKACRSRYDIQLFHSAQWS